MTNNLEAFFRERNLISMVDSFARAYHMTPYEVLTKMTIYEFSINIAMFVIGNIEENERLERASGKKSSNNFKDWGISRVVKKKGE